MTEEIDFRSGRYVTQPTGYRAFMPTPLLPNIPLIMDAEMQVLLSAADRAVGRLDAATELLPNPDLFVAMYVRREAVFSSQIEGTQASLTDLLEYEAQAARAGKKGDVQEIVNYIRAMHYGLSRLKDLPISLRLLREIHVELLKDVRGGAREPGEFRHTQNWIGLGGTINEAIFVPPPPQEVVPAMGELELFLHDETLLPPLIKCGLAHAQFETIHPFLDGNGRMGRLLITFLLCWRGVLKRPLLYISDYLKRHQQEYYERLQRIRDYDDWEGWMQFFLQAVQSVALESTETARRIQNMRDKHREIVGQQIRGTAIGLVLLDCLFEMPMITAKLAREEIQRSFPVANDLIRKFSELGLLREVTGQKRNRVYAYQPYLDLLETRNGTA